MTLVREKDIVLEQLKALGPSVIRTITSWVVAKLLLAATAVVAWPWLEEQLRSPGFATLVEAGVGVVWYAAFRWLETQKDSRWGWFLGLPGAPSYVGQHRAPVLPEGLTISEDGTMLNWQGINYVIQPPDPGDLPEVWPEGDPLPADHGGGY